MNIKEGASYAEVVFNDIDAMILAQDLGLKTFNGFSGFDPRDPHPKQCKDIVAYLTNNSRKSALLTARQQLEDFEKNILILPVGKFFNP